MPGRGSYCSIIPILGMLNDLALRPRAATGKSLPGALFTRSQQRVLGILFGQPKRSFHVSEIIEAANIGRGAVSRELLRLERSRLATVTRQGKRKLYRANVKSAVFPELCSLVRKTIVFDHPIREALKPVADKIDLAFIYGSVATGRDTATSDIDLLAVSDHLHTFEMNALFFSVMHELGRQIEVHHYTRQEFRLHNRPADCFIRRVLAGPAIFLVGSRETAIEICRT